MSIAFAERPQFFEGQYLGAEDLQSLLGYVSELIERHQLGSHSWGIASGIELVYQTSPAGAIEVSLTPGVATDGYGRTVVVTQAVTLDPGLFAGQPAGLVNVWIRYEQAAGQGVRRGFEVCDATDKYSRVIESFVIEVGERRTIDKRQSGVAVGDDAFADAREAPGTLLPEQPLAPDGSVPAQRFPADGDPNLWLVPVGRVLWQGGVIVMPTDASAKQSRIFRRHSGWIGEALHGTGGLLRLRGRSIARKAGVSIDAVCDAELPTEQDLIYCTGHPQTPVFREPIWLEADTRARGHVRLYGTRTEWVDAGGTDYLAQGTVTAIRRVAPSMTGGVDLQILLGQRQGVAGPTRLTIGAATVNGADPCAIGFNYTHGVAIQEDGRVGIGTSDKVLSLPLTLRAIAANGGLIAMEHPGGTLAWQINLGAATNGFNVTQSDPALTNLFIHGATGNVGIGTQTPEAKLDIQQVPSPQGNAIGNAKWFQIGSAASQDDSGRVWFQYGAQLAPLLVMADFDNPPRLQFQQLGTGNEAAPQFLSWIGQARDNSSDLALYGGSVGIGTDTPQRPLHVIGSVHSGGPSGGFSFENRQTAAFIQSPANGERWVWYASGGNARLWSNDDKLTVTPAGRVGIGTDTPTQLLDVRGDIKLGAAGSHFAVGAGLALAIVAGRVSAIGTTLSGIGFIPSNPFSATYHVQFTTPFAAAPVVVATVEGDDDNPLSVSAITAAGFDVSITDVAAFIGSTPQQAAFNFIAIGARP